jgi:signal transduction histidine kinase
VIGRIHDRSRAGQAVTPWPASVVLVLLVLIPTAVVLWLANAAMRNEHLAVRQRLGEAYAAQLQIAQRQVEQAWDARRRALDEAESVLPPRLVFAQLATRENCDSVLVFDGGGRLAYPAPAAAAPPPKPGGPLWRKARRLEFERAEPARAAAIYARAALEAQRIEDVALARAAQARCLAKSGRRAEAAMLFATLADARFSKVRDGTARLLAPSALLRSLELLPPNIGPRQRRLAEGLAARLNNYGDETIGAPQRLLLMKRLAVLWPEGPTLPTLAAEELAAECIERGRVPTQSGRLTPMPGGLWALTSSHARVVALFRGDRLRGDMARLVSALPLSRGVRVAVTAPGEPTLAASFMTRPLNAPLSDWRVTLGFVGADPFEAATRRKTSVYVWGGLLAAAVVGLLSVSVARLVGREMRLTRLKSDLVSTVSHELKTPLSSMRLLLENLRDGVPDDPERRGAYVEMLARENARLAQLVDTFLSFSRLERGRWAFHFETLPVAGTVEMAVKAAGERMQAPGCHLDVILEPGLPAVRGDRDALVMALLNLLDNAYKYSDGDRRIIVRGTHVDGGVRLEEADNGIGFPPADVRRIFEGFYQADQRLARERGGCGLGLSIVRRVVEAHGGRIEAQARAGGGSTFVVTLPAATTTT